MIVVKIIESILLIGIAFLLFKTIFGFLYSMRNHRKRMSRLNEWSNFNQKMIKWSEEIQDMKIKVEYLEFCTERVLKLDYNTMEKIANGKDCLSDVRNEIIKKYSNHIPSLKQELREEKLNKIFK